jgi:hypothetical protein
VGVLTVALRGLVMQQQWQEQLQHLVRASSELAQTLMLLEGSTTLLYCYCYYYHQYYYYCWRYM